MKNENQHFSELSKEIKCITDVNGYFIFVNTLFKENIKYSTKELVAHSILSFIHPNDKGNTQKAILKLIEEKKILKFENECVCKNGSSLHINWTINYIEQSKKIYWVGHNITRYKNTELALLENEKKYENLFEEMESGFVYCEIIVDKAGVPCDYRVLQVNKAYEKQTGILANTIVGKTVLEVFPDIEKSWIDIYGKVALCQKTITFINYNHNTDKYYETTSFSPEKGKFALIFKDVTGTEKETKALKVSLEQSETQYQKVFDTMKEAFAICQIIVDENDKSIDYLFLSVNPSFEKHTGLKINETIGKRILEIYPDIEPIWIERFGKVALTQKSIEFTDYNHNTNKYYETISFSPEKGKFAIIFKDVTQNKQLEKELIEAKEKAETSDLLKSAFLANMSHEIRTPMNSILGFSALLRKKDLKEEKKEQYLCLIEAGGKRLLALISDIVDISKIDANQLTINKTAFNVNHLIDSLQTQFAIQAAIKANIIITKKGLPNNNCFIKTDEIRLTQILSNLLENADKFTNEGEIEFGYLIENNIIKFYVKDTGIGVAKKMQEDIFKRFRQVEEDDSRAVQGTGIGLSIVKGLVELLSGKIWIESEINKGASFYFTLPYQSIQEKTKLIGVKDISLKKDKEAIVLVVEDEESNFLLIEALLEEFDFKIIHAKNGKEAVEMTDVNEIDLILMDIKMPLMNGYEATKKIKKTNKDLPIIAQTAYAMVEDRQKILNAGCDDYISKPLSIDVLTGILDKYLKDGFRN